MADAVEIRFRERAQPGAAAVNPRSISVHGVILAAGASTRMGSPKALLHYRGRTFLERALDALQPACDSVVVVTASDASQVRAVCQKHGVDVVINSAPERGMLSSLQCAIAQRDAYGYLFTPVDYPAIAPTTAAAIVGAFQSAARDAVIPVFDGRHGHPVCISRAVAGQILDLPAGATARDAIHRSDILYLPVADAGILCDVDTPAEHEALCAGERS
jgi:molybdenum cofactor cytidylyltransferase